MEKLGFSRILHFVRHGQYELKEGVFGGVLTDLGRQQAELLAEHYAEEHVGGQFLEFCPVLEPGKHFDDYENGYEYSTSIISGNG